MKTFANVNARDLKQAVALSAKEHRDGGSAAFVGGGSDLLGMVKERIVTPDLLVHLSRTNQGIFHTPHSTTISGQTTLDAISNMDIPVLAQAAASVATPQIRNVGTIAGNVCQRPWCWYFRNGFKCYKAGGDTCFSITGENQFHAIFGGGPSFIVHPSDTAPALVALDAKFRIMGPTGERVVPAADFFVLPKVNAGHENVLGPDEVLASIELPTAGAGMRSAYTKVMDREAWTHAVVSAAVILNLDNGICRSARIVLGGVAPIPWRVTEAEKVLAGQRITPELAAQAGEAAVKDARPLAKNAYKIPLTSATVTRAVWDLAKA
jgi:xanthine dehydrogenase YagS FAD-binding subunit